MLRNLYILVGLIAVGLGFAGIFLPLLPTTPFLLLALFCFARSSPKLERWLLSNRILGPYLQAYFSKQGMPVKQKVITLALLWGTILLSAFLINQIYVRVVLAIVAIGVSIHVLRMKTS